MRKTRRIRITLMRIRIQLPKMMRIHAELRIRIRNTATCSSGNPRSRSCRKTEKSHLDVLHEEDKKDLTHLEPHMHVGNTTVPIPIPIPQNN